MENKALLKKLYRSVFWYRTFGTPDIRENPKFTSKIWLRLMVPCGSRLKMSTSSYSQTDGSFESTSHMVEKYKRNVYIKTGMIVMNYFQLLNLCISLQ